MCVYLCAFYLSSNTCAGKSFLQILDDPELTTEVTMQPVRRVRLQIKRKDISHRDCAVQMHHDGSAVRRGRRHPLL